MWNASSNPEFTEFVELLLTRSEESCSPHDACVFLRDLKAEPDTVYSKILQAAFTDANMVTNSKAFLRVFGVILAVRKPLDIFSLCEVGVLTSQKQVPLLP
ncbi:hypothetical protein HK100_005806, partial [Physocladia obscura]